jgi:MFS family permease
LIKNLSSWALLQGNLEAARALPSDRESSRRGPTSTWPLLGAIASGTVLTPLNSAMIAVALIDLSRHFGLDFHAVTWLISAFYLTSSVGLPVMGRLGDLYGRKRIFLFGLSLVAIASGLAPFAPNFTLLIVLRVVQAVGGSALYPSGLGILRQARVDRHERALAILSSSSSVAASIGPTLGGLLVGFAGWQAIFLVNVPIVAVSLTVSARVLPSDPPREGARRRTREVIESLDPIGGLSFAVSLVALLWFLLSLSTGAAWPSLLIAIAAGAAFTRLERSARNPFIDLQALLANRALVAACLQYALVNVVLYSIFFGMPSFVEGAKGLGPERAGLVILPMTILGVLMYAPAVRVVERFGIRTSLLIGASAMTTGAFLLLAVDEATGMPQIAGSLAVIGVATAFNTLGLQTAMYAAAPRERMGATAGLFQTSRYLGSILSASLLGLVFGHRIDVPRLHVLSGLLGSIGLLILALSLLSSSFGASRSAGPVA